MFDQKLKFGDRLLNLVRPYMTSRSFGHFVIPPSIVTHLITAVLVLLSQNPGPLPQERDVSYGRPRGNHQKGHEIKFESHWFDFENATQNAS